jgi:hypothetical protein
MKNGIKEPDPLLAQKQSYYKGRRPSIIKQESQNSHFDSDMYIKSSNNKSDKINIIDKENIESGTVLFFYFITTITFKNKLY